MARFLAFLNSLLVSLTVIAMTDNDEDTALSQLHRYAYEISMNDGKVNSTGIIIVKDQDNYAVGSMINEFGVTVLNFQYLKKSDKVKLVNVIGFLDKWYIRRILREDIKICMHVILSIAFDKSPKNYFISMDECRYSISNIKHKIIYSFSTLNQDSQK